MKTVFVIIIKMTLPALKLPREPVSGFLGITPARSNKSIIVRPAPTAHSTHILPVLLFAAQSLYSGRQTIVNSRND
jgi:hypothetical protein